MVLTVHRNGISMTVLFWTRDGRHHGWYNDNGIFLKCDSIHVIARGAPSGSRVYGLTFNVLYEFASPRCSFTCDHTPKLGGDTHDAQNVMCVLHEKHVFQVSFVFHV